MKLDRQEKYNIESLQIYHWPTVIKSICDDYLYFNILLQIYNENIKGNSFSRRFLALK